MFLLYVIVNSFSGSTGSWPEAKKKIWRAAMAGNAYCLELQTLLERMTE
jgi:hypothetical protein